MTAPPAFTQFVLKVASRCDLACDHCYVYEAADTGWQRQPKRASEDMLGRVARRIAEHARTHRLTGVQVVLHGGEPLLAGHERLRFAGRTLRAELDAAGCALDLRIHTNAVRLDERFCELFAELGVMVGVSLDGDQASNDRHRRFADGRSSFPQVARALDLLRGPFREIYSGILCTIDVDNDPAAVYRALRDVEPPRADLLLPHATHSQPPARPSLGNREAPAPYADWLLTVYDLWDADGRPFGIRTFDSIHAAFRGGPSTTESLGLEPVQLTVISVSGEIEQVDSLAATYDGAAGTGFDVFRHSFDDAAGHAGFEARRNGLADLCATCRGCPVVEVCGGGLRTHRYRGPSSDDSLGVAPGTTLSPGTFLGQGAQSAPGRSMPSPSHPDPFDNPSVFCADLKQLIIGIRTRDTVAAAAQTPGSTHHALPPDILDELASGYGGARALEFLQGFQQSLRRGLLGRIMATETKDGLAAEAAAALAEFDTTHPQALDAVLAHPYIRVWALRTTTSDADRAHLASIAAAVAIRAGADAEFDVPIIDGAVHLPTLGRLLLGTSEAAWTGPWAWPDACTTRSSRFAVGPQAVGEPNTAAPRATVTLRITRGECAITTAPGWQPVRQARLASTNTNANADHAFTLAIEDTDPYRRCHHWDVQDRLPEAQAAAWQSALPQAWNILHRDHPAYAAGIAAGLTTVVPLVPAASGRDVSATARHAFGSIGAALPIPRKGNADPDAAALTLLMIHEFQHVKLGAVLDMADLHDPSDARLYHAPWREDPRPLEGLLQGTYAHIGVTDFWRIRRSTAKTADEREQAAAEFTRWRDHTVASIDVLNGSGSLTTLGRVFTEKMRATVEPWLAGNRVPSEIGPVDI